jgi:hypothetical protein
VLLLLPQRGRGAAKLTPAEKGGGLVTACAGICC